jgi:hypothetical protein
MMDAVDVLLEAKDRLVDGWCQGHRAEDEHGNYIMSADNTATVLPENQPWALFMGARVMHGSDPRARRWCLLGALEATQQHETRPLRSFMVKILNGYGWSGLISFNDDPTTTQEKVIAMVDEMIRSLKDDPTQLGEQ